MASRPIDVDFEKPIKVEIEPLKKLIEVQLNDDLEYSVKLDEPLPPGKLGVMAGAGSEANYQYLAIQRGGP